MPAAPEQEDAQRMRLMVISHLNDGEFARLLFEKVGSLIGGAFAASLDKAIAQGDASRVGQTPIHLFWFAHHTAMMAALSRLPPVPTLPYGNDPGLERQLCEFILRGIGLTDAAIAKYIDQDISPYLLPAVTTESA
jgi:hypothetical protein